MQKTILVVDDLVSIRQFICETLEKSGYLTLSASNGNDAWQILEENTVDLVLSDYMMPEATGLDLLKKIKTHPQMTHLPVVFLTSEKRADKMREAKQEGLSAWISKPYHVNIFLAQIELSLHGYLSDHYLLSLSQK